MILVTRWARALKGQVIMLPGRELCTLLKTFRDGAAPVSVLVSFAAVRRRPRRTGPGRGSRSQTTLTYRERTPTDLESVLGATPQEFESLILRQPHQGLLGPSGYARSQLAAGSLIRAHPGGASGMARVQPGACECLI